MESSYIYEIIKNGISYILNSNEVIGNPTIKFSREKDQIFYKKELSSLQLVKGNAKLIIEWYNQGFEVCDSYELNIYRKCETGDILINGINCFKIYEGIFRSKDFILKLDTCVVEVESTHTNDNTCWLEGCEEEYNVIPPLNKYTVEYYHDTSAGGGSPSIIEENAIKLQDVIEYLAKKSCSSINCVKSDFFQWNADNISSINYVTGEASELGELLLTQYTNITYPNATNPAGKLNLKLCDILEYLKEMFNIYPSIINGCFRLEHKIFYNQQQTIDFKNSTNSNIKKQIEGNKTIYYRNVDFYKKEYYEYGDKFNTGKFNDTVLYKDNSGIYFDNSCSLEDNEIFLTNVYADIFNVPDSYSNYRRRTDGTEAFFLMNCELNTSAGIDYKTIISRYFYSPAGTTIPFSFQENGALSWSMLITNYLRQDRSFKNATIQDPVYPYDIVFENIKSCSKSSEITIPFCCENHNIFKPESLVRLQHDEWGEIDKFEYNLFNKHATLNYNY